MTLSIPAASDGFLEALAARAILAAVYGVALTIAAVGRALGSIAFGRSRRIVVTGTFYNLNWLRSHAIPLARSGVEEVIVVTDRPLSEIQGVRFACPPRWLARCVSRAVAKLIWLIWVGLRYRPDLYMGYHIFPGAVSALMAGRLFGRPACYQMTGGPVEIEGGGCAAENRVLCALGRPSGAIEKLARAVVRQFDLIVVRGKKAAGFVRRCGYAGSLEVITGSVALGPGSNGQPRDIDVAFVGRMTPTKRPELFVRAMAGVCARIPGARAMAVGEGPLLEPSKRLAAELKISDRIEFVGQRDDVAQILSRSKVFVLTSRSEGLSIAMAEAMACGAVPVVADVGELADLVEDGVNGYLVRGEGAEPYAARVSSLLEQPDLWRCYSRAARCAARERCGVDAVAGQWRRALDTVLGKAKRSASEASPQ